VKADGEVGELLVVESSGVRHAIAAHWQDRQPQIQLLFQQQKPTTAKVKNHSAWGLPGKQWGDVNV
jgi:hypothetical protein